MTPMDAGSASFALNATVPFQIMAGNLRKIDSFVRKLRQREAAQTDGQKPRKRRRTTKPIQSWLSECGSAGGRDRAPPGE